MELAERLARYGRTTALSSLVWGNHMSLLISALVTFLVVILILYLINLLPLDGRAKQIVRIIVIILGVLSLLKYIAVF
jgi:hypothetical protein